MPLDTTGFPVPGTPLVQSPRDGSVTIVSPPIGATSTDGLVLANPSASSAGAQQWSSRIRWSGFGQGTTASAPQQVDWIAEVQPVQGSAAPTANLVFSSQINAGGYTTQATLTSAGALTTTSTLTATQVFVGSANVSISNNGDQLRLRATDGTTCTETSTSKFYVLGSSFGMGGVTTPDLILTRSAAATLQQGAANAASPVAQTLQAQGSRSGTDTNVGGANYTIASGQGTGTGTASSLIFQTPVVVGSGTGAQTMTNTVTMSAGTATFPLAPVFSSTTSTRVHYSGTSGILSNSAGFVYDGTTLTVAHAGGADNIDVSTSSATGYAQIVHLADGTASGALAATATSFSPSGLYLANQYALTAAKAGGLLLQTNTTSPIAIGTNAVNRLHILGVAGGGSVAGNIGVGQTNPTAFFHIKAGAAAAGSAPLKLTSGTNLTTAEAGAFEYNGTNLFFTRSGTTREGIITQSAVTTEAAIQDTTVTVNIGGTTYKLLAKA